MSLHKDPELKTALLSLPQKEKDKLLIRLINKDKMLIKQLHYQLLEDEYDLELRIEQLKNQLHTLFEENRSSISNTAIYSNFKTLNNLIRQASGLINEHEKITKDKYSVAEARLFVITEPYQLYPILFEKSHLQVAIKLHKYIAARIKTALNKTLVLHEDLQFDLQDSTAKLEQIAKELN